MGNLNEAEKRDFIDQVIDRLKENSDVLAEKGFDSSNRVGELEQQSTAAQTAETAQQKAEREAREATNLAQQELLAAYKNASATVDLIVGIMGKDHPLSQQLRKLRN